VCTTCEEHFTRRYSATRHNLAIHNNKGEIVSLLEYIVGRTSGRYTASHPFWYRRHRKEKPIHTFAPGATVADSMEDTFRPVGLQREQQGQYQYQYHQQSLEEQELYLGSSNQCRHQSLRHHQQFKTILRMPHHIYLIKYFSLIL
jgi:hypothetical protein